MSPWARDGGPCPDPTPAPRGQPAPLAPAAARAPSHLNRALRDKPRHQLDKATVASPGLPPDGHWASGTPRLRARPSGAPSEQPPEPGLTRDRAKPPPPAPTSSLIPPSRPMGQSIPGISRSRHRPKCRVPGLLPGALGGGRVPWAVPSIPPPASPSRAQHTPPPHPRAVPPCPGCRRERGPRGAGGRQPPGSCPSRGAGEAAGPLQRVPGSLRAWPRAPPPRPGRGAPGCPGSQCPLVTAGTAAAPPAAPRAGGVSRGSPGWGGGNQAPTDRMGP